MRWMAAAGISFLGMMFQRKVGAMGILWQEIKSLTEQLK